MTGRAALVIADDAGFLVFAVRLGVALRRQRHGNRGLGFEHDAHLAARPAAQPGAVLAQCPRSLGAVAVAGVGDFVSDYILNCCLIQGIERAPGQGEG